MAPIKFEEHLKEKLEQRRIQPSSDAWTKLNDRLDVSEEKQNNKGFWWLGVAAAIVGVLLAIIFVFNSNTEIVEPNIVDTETENIIENQDLQKQNVIEKTSEIVEKQKEEQVAETNVSKEKSKVQLKKAPLKTILKQKENVIIPNKVEEVVAQINSETENSLKEEEQSVINKKAEVLTFEAQKINEVVAKIQELQKTSNEATDEDIEALLNAAQKEITMQKLYNEATKTVDADALLRSVENDLEQSFRDKVFTAIKSGYKTVKTVVVERNN